MTPRGIGLLAGGTVLLAAGFGFDYPELALLGAAAALALLYAVGYALWQPRLSVARIVDPDRVSRGEPSNVTLTIHNRDRLRPANLVAEDRCGLTTVPVPVLRLRPRRNTTVSYPLPTHRRGVVTIGPLRVSRSDPLGLVCTARHHAGTARVWVRPRAYPLTAVPAGIARSLDGCLDRMPHGSITFDALREYVVGDELRRVHWRTSARVGELMVREQVDTSLPRIVVLLDNRIEVHPLIDGVAETFESACEVAASVVVAARRDDLPITVLPVAGKYDETGSDDHLDFLAAVHLHPLPGELPARAGRAASPEPEPLQAAAAWLRQLRWGDTLVFLTGPRGDDGLRQVGTLRDCYPSIVVGRFGDAPRLTGVEGVLVINARDGAHFAAEWNGIRRW